MDRQAATVRKGRKGQGNLRDQVAVQEGLRTWANADMLPTPNTINRTGEKMMKGKCPGRKYRTSLGLEQVAEISSGIMPKEMDSLDDAPVFKHLWPTPNSGDGVRGPRKPNGKRGLLLTDCVAGGMKAAVWPTPQHRDYRSPDKPESQRFKNKVAKGWTIDLNSAVSQDNVIPGQLNPDWTECLMGWPPGWSSVYPLSPEVFDLWRERYRSWWPSSAVTVWHCLELIYPRLTTIKEGRVNRLKAIGNGQVPQTMVAAVLLLAGDMLNV